LSIPQETIELVRDRAQIEEIVKRYVPTLKKSGKNFTGLCPFHKEKTPSFSVTPDKQIFYCYGCHAGGNIFSFISKIEGLTFPESVKFVGDLVGIRVENKYNDKSGPAESKLDKLKEINRSAMDFYHKFIFSDAGKTGLNYLLKRGVTEESIKEFKLGFAPDSWHSLINHLRSMNVPIDFALENGLAGSKDKQNYYDRFRNRAIFPIINHRNEPVAFGGRAIDQTEPKYLNSPESVIYRKREVLYALNNAKAVISDYKRAIIVEGYLDVIGCHQAVIKNAVAPLGTALTLEQLKLLSRYCKEVILVFDADSAGIKASLRSIDIFRNVNLEVRISVLPEFDPFEFILKRGAREFMAVIDKAMDPVDYQIMRAVEDGNKSKDKLSVLLNIFSIIRNVEYETERQKYLKNACNILNISENTIISDFNKFLKKDNKPKKEIFINYESSKQDFLVKSYREIVILLCNFPELIDHAVADFPASEFPDQVSKNIFLKLTELYSKNEKISINKIYDYFLDGEEKAVLEKNCCNIEDYDSAYNDYTKRYLRIKLEHIDLRIDYYKNLISSPGNTNRKELDGYYVEYQSLLMEKARLEPHL
jgi:DNA primase